VHNSRTRYCFVEVRGLRVNYTHLKEGACDMARPNHMYNSIIGFLGELPLRTERFSLIRNRFRGPVDRGPSAPGNGTWSVVPSALTDTHLPGAERFRFSNVATYPEEAVFSPFGECLDSGANHSNLLTLFNSARFDYLNIVSIPPTSKEVGFLEVKR